MTGQYCTVNNALAPLATVYSVDIIMSVPAHTLTFNQRGGFLKTPTPGGVPVRTTSPGFRVTNLRRRRRRRRRRSG